MNINWRDAEVYVHNWLVDQGLICVHKNLRLKQGELDWVGYEGETLVFIEIKASKVSQELASSRITKKKKQKLQTLSLEVLQLPQFSKVKEFRVELVTAVLKRSSWTFVRMPIDFTELEIEL